MSIGERLKEERKKLSVSQSVFASFAGVTTNSQCHYEKNLRSPDTQYLTAIAAHGVDVLYVCTGKRVPAGDNRLTETEQALIDAYFKLGETDKKIIKSMIYAYDFTRKHGSELPECMR